MSFTGVGNLDASIDKANAWLADIGAGFGTGDRHLAYRVLRAWLHCLRGALRTVPAPGPGPAVRER